MPARQLRATRYAKPHNEWLQQIILEDLLTWDFEETKQAYTNINTMMLAKLESGYFTLAQVLENRALLGCNDRYYLLTGILSRRDLLHPWLFARCREVEAEPYGCMDLWARGHYKALVLNESVPTPQGWKLHGDLIPGDQVFGPDGSPCNVVARTPVFYDADCYSVGFDDGSSIIASGDHLWTVEVSHRARLPGGKRTGHKTVTIATRELIGYVDRAKRIKSAIWPRIPVTQAIKRVERSLPLDPYVLGAWLGDGAVGGMRITSGVTDAGEMERTIRETGVSVARSDHTNAVSLRLGSGRRGDRTSSDVANALRTLGVYEDKHIPLVYFMGSEKQRFSLLQGLMDTDGSCHKKHGQCVFCSANERLANDTLDLCLSLGIKATIGKRHGNYKGEPRAFWQVCFQGDAYKPPFRLARKRAACRPVKPSYWRVTSVEQVAPVPVSCIQVDRDDGLYLVGRNHVTTHNSTIITFAGIIQELMVDSEQKIVIFSAVKQIAAAFLTQIKEEFENNELLKLIYHDVLYRNPRTRGVDGKPSKWGLARGITVKRRSNPKEASIEAHGLLDGQPTSRHYDKMHFDDIVTQDYLHEEQIKKTTLRLEMADNLGTHLGCDKALAGTYYHFNDTHVQMRDRGSFKVRIYPATDDGTLEGTPVLMSPKEWEKKKRDQRSTVATQMLCNPTATGDASFMSIWIRGYEAIPAIMNVYIMCDPSKGSTERSDRTAIAVIGVDGKGIKYLLDGYCHRMKLSDRYRKICELRRKWMQHRGVQMVKVGYERYGMLSDLEVIKDMMLADDDVFEILELNTPRQGGDSKNDRIQRLEPDIQYERFFFPCVAYNPNTGGDSYWSVLTQELLDTSIKFGRNIVGNVGQILWRPVQGLLRRQLDLQKTGQIYRIPTPIKRRNGDNDIYDLTREFFEELIRHPFGAHDDLIDAASRIYDMDPLAPTIHDAGATESLEAQFDDAMWG